MNKAQCLSMVFDFLGHLIGTEKKTGTNLIRDPLAEQSGAQIGTRRQRCNVKRTPLQN